MTTKVFFLIIVPKHIKYGCYVDLLDHYIYLADCVKSYGV